MEKSLSFFRVFDIAFFAPGILLFAAICYRFFPEFPIAGIGDSTPRAIAVVTVSLTFIYLLGLLCHPFQRAVWELCSDVAPRRRRHRQKKNSMVRKRWTAPLARTGAVLLVYARYCWNPAVAVIPSSLLFSPCFPGVLSGLLVSFALMLLGSDFNRSMHRAVTRTRVFL